MQNIFLSILVFIGFMGFAQNSNKILSLELVIELAQEQSPDAVLAKHKFRSSYWEYRSYKSGMLPSVTLGGQLVGFENGLKSTELDDGSYTYNSILNNSSNLSLSIDQNVGFTGGNIFIESGLSRLDNFLIDTLGGIQYTSTPLTIGYSQPAFQYNAYKWQKKIEPLKYEEAKREYIYQHEIIALKAVDYFFNLAASQLNVEIAETNYNNNDTLYKIAQGRYNIGTIAENELLQLELAFLGAKSDLAQSKINHEISKFRLRSFLGFNNKVEIELIMNTEIPVVNVGVEEALAQALRNSGELISQERRLYEADRDVAQARAENRFNANLYATYGLNQTGYYLGSSYTNPSNQQSVLLGIQIPILDWGEGKGKYRMAQSNQEVIKLTVEQERIDFEQEVMLKVLQFNQQDDQLLIAAKSDQVARKRYEVAKQRFLIGKIDVTDLNIASTEKDLAQRNYIQSQKTYWDYYYTIRQYTLYDFAKGMELKAAFDEIKK
jgi:outer membrane protein TolC